MGLGIEGQHAKMLFCVFCAGFLYLYCAKLLKTEINEKNMYVKLKKPPIAGRLFILCL